MLLCQGRDEVSVQVTTETEMPLGACGVPSVVSWGSLKESSVLFFGTQAVGLLSPLLAWLIPSWPQESLLLHLI